MKKTLKKPLKQTIETHCSTVGCGNRVRKTLDVKYLQPNGKPNISCYCTTCARKMRASSTPRNIEEITEIHLRQQQNISPVRRLSPEECQLLSKIYQPPKARPATVFYGRIEG